MNERKSLLQSMFDMKWLEDNAYKKSAIHQLHPTVKIIIAMVFVIKVAATPLSYMFVYLKLLLLLSLCLYVARIRVTELLKRTAPGLVIVSFFGISYFFSYPIQSAFFLFVGVVVKVYLTISFVLMTVASTGIDGISNGLLWLKIPRLLILQLQLTYRYLGLFVDRVNAMSLSYKLRSNGNKIGQGIGREAWGSFVGHLFLGAMEDARMIQQAMALRGFHLNSHLQKVAGPTKLQWIIGMCSIVVILVDL